MSLATSFNTPRASRQSSRSSTSTSNLKRERPEPAPATPTKSDVLKFSPSVPPDAPTKKKRKYELVDQYPTMSTIANFLCGLYETLDEIEFQTSAQVARVCRDVVGLHQQNPENQLFFYLPNKSTLLICPVYPKPQECKLFSIRNLSGKAGQELCRPCYIKQNMVRTSAGLRVRNSCLL